jgi:hypothetical protein
LIAERTLLYGLVCTTLSFIRRNARLNSPDISMHICYKKIAAMSPRHSVTARLGSSDDEAAGPTLEAINDTPLPTADPTDFPRLDPAVARLIEKKKRCALELIERQHPLLAGEMVQCDSFSYLTGPFGDFPPGTPVLHRITNQAEMYYLFDDLQMDGGRLEAVTPMFSPALRIAAGPSEDAVLVGADPITNIAIAISTKLLERLGAAIIDEVFPPQPPSYFEKVYETLTKILGKELTRQTINEITGGIDGTVAWIRHDYADMKSQGEPPAELIRLLRHQSRDMHKLIRTLMLRDYRMPALSVFLLAAGIHLVLIQEIRLVSASTADSIKFGALAAEGDSLAGEYAKHSSATFADLLKVRNKVVKVKLGEQCYQQWKPPDTVCTQFWHWVDSFNGKSGPRHNRGKHDEGKAAAKEDRKTYLVAVEKELRASLKDPDEFARVWRKLD